jgi:S-adenosylmethionine:tRNA-ribosyltransferase-isomerase (queuine synthetase)
MARGVMVAPVKASNVPPSRLTFHWFLSIKDAQFNQIADFLQSGDLLVMNNTKVIPARLFGAKATGGKVEIMIERLLDENQAD